MRRIALSMWLIVLALGSILAAPRPARAQGQDCLRVGGDLVISAEDWCQGDAVVVGGSLVVRGRVGGDAVAVGGSVRVSGRVEGDIVSVGGGVYLEAGAVVGGDVTAIGGELQRAPGAVVRGNTLQGRLPLGRESPWEGRLASYEWVRYVVAALAAVLAYGLCLLTVLVLRSVWPRRMRTMVRTLRRNLWASLGMGLAVTLALALALVVLSFVLAVTVIGAFLIPFLFLFVFLLYLVGLTLCGLALGERLITRPEKEPASLWLIATVGLAVVVPLVVFPGVLFPCLGWLWAVAVPGVGVGAIVLSRVGTLSPPE